MRSAGAEKDSAEHYAAEYVDEGFAWGGFLGSHERSFKRVTLLATAYAVGWRNCFVFTDGRLSTCVTRRRKIPAENENDSYSDYYRIRI
jgi:hypothetical protein